MLHVLTVPQSVRHFCAVNLETYPRISQTTGLLHPKREVRVLRPGGIFKLGVRRDNIYVYI